MAALAVAGVWREAFPPTVWPKARSGRGRLLWLEREQKREDSLETYLGGPVPCLLPDLAIFRQNKKNLSPKQI